MKTKVLWLVFGLVIGCLIAAPYWILLRTVPGPTQGQAAVQAASVSRPVTVTLLATQNITTDGQTTSVGVSYYRDALAYITTTVGTGAITCTWQTSPDNLSWFAHTAVPAMTTSGSWVQSLSLLGPFLRVSYDVSTGGSVTPTIWLSLKE